MILYNGFGQLREGYLTIASQQKVVILKAANNPRPAGPPPTQTTS